VAVGIARSCRLNVALTEAIALGHDCGHGPGGHASEDALSPFVEGGYDHATWGADVVLQPLNLCEETLDGIRNHSWSRPAPSTPEGEVVSWADRIAYVCHDFEDAVSAGIVTVDMLPDVVRARCGASRREQLGAFIGGVVDGVTATGSIGMTEPLAEALAAFRSCNYERIYLRPRLGGAGSGGGPGAAGPRGARGRPPEPDPRGRRARAGLPAGSAAARTAAVTYVGGMTDRYAFQSAVAHLGWDPASLPRAPVGLR
jgi:dGTPase